MEQALPPTMNAVAITMPGGPEVLRLERRALPELRPRQVLVKVAAAGVNGPDLMQRRGLYPPPPGASDLPGLEVAGTIAAIGQGAQGWSIGDRVTGLTNGGGYAEYCAIDARHCLPVPAGLTLEEAASLPETFFTVWSNVFLDAGLLAGETLLVHGGAGGIGSTAIQLAKARGARVIATDSPAERCAFCRELGADIVIDYREEDFVPRVREAGGANVILDIVGGPNIAANLKAAAPDGRIIQLAFAKGSRVEIDLLPVMLKRLTYRGSTLRSRPADYKARVAADLSQHIWPLLEAGRIRPVVNAVFPLEAAAEAHRLMETATHRGKIVLAVAS